MRGKDVESGTNFVFGVDVVFCTSLADPVCADEMGSAILACSPRLRGN